MYTIPNEIKDIGDCSQYYALARHLHAPSYVLDTIYKNIKRERNVLKRFFIIYKILNHKNTSAKTIKHICKEHTAPFFQRFHYL